MIQEKKAIIYNSPSGAIFSDDRIHRYALWRTLKSGSGTLLIIALNPSTADENINDPTIRRCIGFANDWGFNKLIVANLFSYRATLPTDLKQACDPVGPENDLWLRSLNASAEKTLVAWGIHGTWKNRDADVTPFLKNMICLGKTLSGCPKHPLYVKKTQQPVVYAN